MNLVNEQVKQHTYFQVALKKLEGESLVAKDQQLNEPAEMRKMEQIH